MPQLIIFPMNNSHHPSGGGLKRFCFELTRDIYIHTHDTKGILKLYVYRLDLFCALEKIKLEKLKEKMLRTGMSKKQIKRAVCKYINGDYNGRTDIHRTKRKKKNADSDFTIKKECRYYSVLYMLGLDRAFGETCPYYTPKTECGQLG